MANAITCDGMEKLENVRAAIIQSSYLPWKGYFDIIANVDAFVFLDDVQYTRNDWRNRNRFKFSGGASWLTVPCGQNRERRICDVTLEDPSWQRKHWDAIRQNYVKCPYFGEYKEFFEDLYLGRTWKTLSEFNQYSTQRIAEDILGIRTAFYDSRELAAGGAKANKLIAILQRIEPKVDVYVSGPSAKDYIQDGEFEAVGMSVEYHEYSGYPEYTQRFPPFRHDVSVVDLLFNVGPDAPKYIWGWRNLNESSVDKPAAQSASQQTPNRAA